MTSPNGLRKRAASFVAQIDEAELACRIMEAAMEKPRPAGLTAAQALECLDPKTKGWALSMARAAMNYWRECIDAGSQVS